MIALLLAMCVRVSGKKRQTDRQRESMRENERQKGRDKIFLLIPRCIVSWFVPGKYRRSKQGELYTYIFHNYI